MKNNIFHGQLIKKENGTLSTVSTSTHKYQEFLKNLEPGQTVEIFMEANESDGTLAQLAKIHACIRQFAKDTGDTPQAVKFEVKKRSSLCFITEYEGEKVLFCKSLGDCSKDELGLVLKVIIEMGEFVGINFN